MIFTPDVNETINEVRAALYRLQREMDTAHLALDESAVPRKDLYGEAYTLTARVELLRQECTAQELKTARAEHEYDALLICYAACERRRLKLEAELSAVRFVRRLARARTTLARIKRTGVRLIRAWRNRHGHLTETT